MLYLNIQFMVRHAILIGSLDAAAARSCIAICIKNVIKSKEKQQLQASAKPQWSHFIRLIQVGLLAEENEEERKSLAKLRNTGFH